MDFKINRFTMDLIEISYPGYPLNYLTTVIQSINYIIRQTYESFLNLRKSGYTYIDWNDNYERLTDYIMNILNTTLSIYPEHMKTAIITTEQGRDIFNKINEIILWLFQQAGIQVVY